MSECIEKFLNKPANMHAREAILMHRLFYDIKAAAARRGYYLNTYFDDVDHDGFDVIFDDQDCIKKAQVKSVCSSASTNSWAIQKKILRPSIYLIDKLGFEASAIGEGTEGGVVLIEFKDIGGALEVRYFYTDLFILMAFECEIISRKNTKKNTAIQKCLKGLYEGLRSERLSVPKCAFIEAKDADALLALCGLHSNRHSSWKENVIATTNHSRQSADRSLPLPVPIEKLSKFTFDEIISLAADKDLLHLTSRSTADPSSGFACRQSS